MGRAFRVGEWLVEPDLNQMTRGDQKVSVEPKVIEVLECLADCPGEVLSKEKVIKTVWPDTFVSDGILTYSISELRKAFGDDARDPRFIQTIPRKGYRLIAPVAQKTPSAGTLPSIAVLSFADMSAEKDQEYLCDGIAEDIINDLMQLKGLRVVARTSSFAFKAKAEDVRAIGRKLGVANVLEGSVRKLHNRLRVTAQLINVQDGCHLWSERFDREASDIFTIQDDIARSIALTLQVTLSAREHEAIGRIPTTDVQAYDYYLRGRQFYYQYKRKGIEFALRMFRQAIELDPSYARAHAGIADCCSFLFLYAGSHPEHRQQAEAASLRAVDLDPASAEAQASRGVALSLSHAYDEAAKAFETAIRLDPRLFEAYYFYARFAFAYGYPENAIELYRKAAEVNPQDYQAPLLAAQIYTDLGRNAEAEASRLRGIKIAEARLKLNPDDVRALYMGANGLVALGECEQGLEWANRALAMDPEEPMVLYNVACIQCLAGRVQTALDTLEKAVTSGLTEKGWLVHDSNLDALRGDPRFQALLQQLE
jgi:TolB-like protein/Flp pilus assembly protein TadD